MRRTNWLAILAVISATCTTALPERLAISPETLLPSATLYVRDDTATTETAAAADTTTTSAAAESTTTSAATDTSTTESTTSSSTDTTTSATTTASTTDSTATTSSASSTTSTTASTTDTTASTTTTASSTSTTSTSTVNSAAISASEAAAAASESAAASASASAAAKAKYNHDGTMRAIIVFSIIGGLCLLGTIYWCVRRHLRNKKNKTPTYRTAGSSYSVIPLTAEGKENAAAVRESMMFQ